MDQQFEIADEYIELNKLLKASGLCDSGGQAKMMIDNGLVTVDGKIETRKRCKVKVGMVVIYDANCIRVVDKENS